MKAVRKDTDLWPSCRHDLYGRFKRRDNRPWKKFQHDAKATTDRAFFQFCQTVGKAREVGIVGGRDDLFRAEFCTRVKKPVQGGDIRIGLNFDELDVMGANPCLPQGASGGTHHRRVVHQGIAGAGFRYTDKPQAHIVKTSISGCADKVRRREVDGRQMSQG